MLSCRIIHYPDIVKTSKFYKDNLPIATHLAAPLTGLVTAKRPNPLPLYIKISSDLSEINYYQTIKNKSALDYITTIPSSYLITPLRYIQNKLPENTARLITALLEENKRYTEYEGITTSWDRSIDSDVWTTNIDTLFFHKFLKESGILEDPAINTAVEIGVGGGGLSALLCAELPNLKDIYFTDISLYALRCALLNIKSNSIRQPLLHPYWGKGLHSINVQADLIIINPPYIRVPPFVTEDSGDPYRGTGLIREIMEIGITKLNPRNPNAAIYINISSLAQKDLNIYKAEFKDRLNIEPVGECLNVPLKIVSAKEVWPQWLDWLAAEGGLTFNPHAAPHEEPYWHKLQIYKITPL